jgi:cell division septum initiation protein DivIVA
MAMAMGGDKDELDAWWDDAIEHYERFLDSEYNDIKQSELECINEYVKSLRPDGV